MNRVLPHNIEAEQAVLGGLMFDMEAFDDIAGLVEVNDFYRPAHRKIFEAIQTLHRKGQNSDIVVLSNYIQQNGDLEVIGGPKYLAELLENTSSIVHLEDYSKIVKDKALVRKMVTIAQQIVEDGLSENLGEIEDFLERSESNIFNVAQSGENKAQLFAPPDLVELSLKKIEASMALKGNIVGIPSGFIELDQLTSGFHPGELTIIAARPSMGKTALGLNLVSQAALREKKSVAFFSVEMPKEQLMIRILASESKTNSQKIRVGDIDDKSWSQLINTAAKVSSSQLFINDTSNISPFDVRSVARKQKSKHGLDMIVIDYLQLMSLKQKVESREREVSEISKSLKSLAKELKIPIIALSQLNRGVEGRSNRRPLLSDLRESGSLEQDADVIMMIYREDYYERDNPSGSAEIIIGKQRNGPTGTVKLLWEPSIGRFSNDIESQKGPTPPLPTDPKDMPPLSLSSNRI